MSNPSANTRKPGSNRRVHQSAAALLAAAAFLGALSPPPAQAQGPNTDGGKAYLFPDNFAAVGHDRGGRVVHRLALDHADKVSRAAVLDIIPTKHFYEHLTQESATAYYHWFFLVQPSAEKIIESNLEMFVRPGKAPTSK